MVEKITILGKEFEVDETLAATLREREAGFDTKLQETSNELGELRKLRDSKVDESQRNIYDFYADPVGSIKKVKAEISAEVDNKVDKVIDAKIAIKTFWFGFYLNNPDLAKHKDIVNAVTQAHLQAITATQTEEEATALIKEKTLAKLAELRREKPNQEEPLAVESGSVLGKFNTKVENTSPQSLTEKMKERRTNKLT